MIVVSDALILSCLRTWTQLGIFTSVSCAMAHLSRLVKICAVSALNATSEHSEGDSKCVSELVGPKLRAEAFPTDVLHSAMCVIRVTERDFTQFI